MRLTATQREMLGKIRQIEKDNESNPSPASVGKPQLSPNRVVWDALVNMGLIEDVLEDAFPHTPSGRTTEAGRKITDI